MGRRRKPEKTARPGTNCGPSILRKLSGAGLVLVCLAVVSLAIIVQIYLNRRDGRPNQDTFKRFQSEIDIPVHLRRDQLIGALKGRNHSLALRIIESGGQVDLGPMTVPLRGTQTGAIPLYLLGFDNYVSGGQTQDAFDVFEQLLKVTGAVSASPAQLFHGGVRPLFTATILQDPRLTASLLKHGASTRPEPARSLLHLLAEYGKGAESISKFLFVLDKQPETVDVRTIEYGHFSPASWWKHSEEFRRLCKLSLETDLEAVPFVSLLKVEEELGNAILQQLLGDGLSVADAAVSDEDGRNAFHVAAIQGCSWLIHGVCAAAKTKREAKALLRALRSPDMLGRTALHHAAMRFGTDHRSAMQVFRTLTASVQSLEALADARGSSLIEEDLLRTYCPADLLGKGCDDYSHVTIADEQSNVDIVRPTKRSIDHGGWIPPVDRQGQGETCDIAEVYGDWGIVEDLSRELKAFLYSSKPVIFRGGARGLDGLAQALSRKVIIEKFGDVIVKAGTIPYFDSFGATGLENITMKNFVDHLDRYSNQQEGDRSPLYLFDTLPIVFEAVKSIVEVVAHIDGVVPTTEDPSDTRIQVYLGPADSGAPWHFHRSAVNALVFGRKRWRLLPPAHAMYSTVPSSTAFSATGALPETRTGTFMELVQEAGDLLFVPDGWAHMTMNEATSAGVAFEDFAFPPNEVSPSYINPM